MDPFFKQQKDFSKMLYINVTNTSEIKKLILNASLPFTLINPKLIVDPFQLSVAITKAQYNMKDNCMKTKNFQTEIIYCLSPSRNITESLNTFTSKDLDTEVLVIGETHLFPSVRAVIKGTEVPLEHLRNMYDRSTVCYVYQIGPDELKVSTLLDSIVSRLSSKEYSHSIANSDFYKIIPSIEAKGAKIAEASTSQDIATISSVSGKTKS